MFYTYVHVYVQDISESYGWMLRWKFLCERNFEIDNNNNNNTQDDIYGAVIISTRVHSVHVMYVEQRQVSANPQTKPPDLGCESACRLLSSTTTIAIYYYYSARKLILIYRPTEGRRLSWPRHCRKVCTARVQGCKSMAFAINTTAHSTIRSKDLAHCCQACCH